MFFKKIPQKEIWKLCDIKSNKKLVKKYPFLLIKHKNREEDKYLFTWADEFPKGWWKAFGQDFCNEFKVEWNKLSKQEQKSFSFIQIKEKFNELRIYTNFYNEGIRKVIEKYARLSPLFCISCGKRATKVTTGYNCSLCDECFEKTQLNDSDFIPIEVWLDIGEE